MNAILGAALRLLPTALACSIVRRVASRPTRARVLDLEAEAVAAARRTWLLDGDQLRAWEWGEGPTVCLVHGWGGRASQMAVLGQRLAGMGFRAVAIDVAGHGESVIPKAAWEYFMRDTSLAVASLQPAAIVGHSAGGLAMMASRRTHGVQSPSYVCVCAPSHPYPPVRTLRQRLNPSTSVVQCFQDDLARQFRQPWAALEHGCVWDGAGDDLLLCYDRSDRYIQVDDPERIHARCIGSTLVWTTGLGHSRILLSQELADAIRVFFLRRLSLQDA